jgi:hypothetical protein
MDRKMDKRQTLKFKMEKDVRKFLKKKISIRRR